MKKFISIFSILTLFFITSQSQAQNISIIPKPVKLELSEGVFTFSDQTKIWIPNTTEMEKLGSIITQSVNMLTGLSLNVTSKMTREIPASLVRVVIDSTYQNKEAYSLSINPNEIRIIAGNGAGIFYAIQSLLQLFPVNETNNLNVPCLKIEDFPRFKWRGTHLDVSRHFFPVDFIKKYIDILAMYKINTFHWHLTDDQGWRIEIKAYPKLTEIGAWRKEMIDNDKPYGGFYTQDQIREVVDYAKSKYITIVPEIEMPGHSLAALASYPEYSCTGGPFDVGNLWGIIEDVYCAGNDTTFYFLQDILTEVMDLFPSEYIHVGGDEVPKIRWQNCDKCQSRMQSENLKDEHELQSYFIQRIEKFVNSKGRKIIGWDEILEGGLAPNAAVMSWRGTEGGIAAAKMKHNVVMSPGTHCYFDHYQGLSGEPKAIGGFTPLEKVYSYEPVPDVLNEEEAKYIMGAQANMWSEYYETTTHVEYMLLPRLCALSEVIWSPRESKNINDFLNRMSYHYDLLAVKNINYRIPTPTNLGGEYLINESEVFQLNGPTSNSKIFYTLDGSEPTTNSSLYSEPFVFDKPALLKAKTFLPNGKNSITSTVQFSIIDTTENGLYYKYYEGEWDSIPKFWELRPERKGKIYKMNLNEIKNSDDNFGIDFYGFIEIEEDGVYTFYLTSDDGSNLYIDNKIVVNNDGQHSNQEASGKIELDSGRYPFRVFYFEKRGGQNLTVEFEGPGITRQTIPAGYFFLSN